MKQRTKLRKPGNGPQLLALFALLLHLLLPATGAQAQAPSTQIFLPLVSSGGAFTPAPAPTPDLIFTPNELTLQAGGAISTVVTISPTTSLISATFALSDTLGDVTTSFVANPDGESGMLILSAPASADERDGSTLTTVNGTSGDGSKGWVGAVRLTVQTSTTARTFFVNPVTGNDDNDGSQSNPLKTLTKALSKAKFGDTIKLALGVYSKASNGEQFTDATHLITVPAGVRIVGSLEANGGGDRSVLRGADSEVGLNFLGNATVKNIMLENFGLGMLAAQGKQTFSNIILTTSSTASFVNVNGRFIGAGGFIFKESTQATFSGSSFVINVGDGFGMEKSSQLSLVDSTIAVNPNDTSQSAKGLQILGQAKATLKNTKFTVKRTLAIEADFQAQFIMDGGRIDTTGSTCETLGGGIALGDAAKATLKNNVVFGFLGSGITMRHTTSASLSDVTINRFGFGVPPCNNLMGIQTVSFAGQVDENVTLNLHNTFVLGYASGVDINAKGTTTIDGGDYRANGVGINVHASSKVRPVVNITGVAVENNQVGIHVDSSVVGTLGTKIRNSSVFNNNIGIEVSRGINVNGVLGCFVTCLDLGRSVTDPGNNIIRNNTKTGVFVGFGAVVDATGNTWNPNIQLTDSNGQYAAGLTILGDRSDPLIHGVNFFLDGFDSRGALTQIRF